ncbi:Aldehyde dehydrogenase family [Popillia japonica]|uniref:Aldehyde dehydrogenase family n=1 Tax=Popillia japonica TaxID=7064 RepID=A0AAW1N8D2_POPJA
MLSVCRVNVVVNLQRYATRCLASIVPEVKVDDFDVKNEPVYQYLKGSKERTELEKALKETAGKTEDIPIVIGDKEYKTDDVRYQVMPHNHKQKIAKFYYADAKLVNKAIDVAVETQKKWDRVPIPERLRIWEKAASLMAGQYRQTLNAATILD